VYRTLGGEVLALLQTAEGASFARQKIGDGEIFDGGRYADLLSRLTWGDIDGYLYVIPYGELFDVPWESVNVGGKTLADQAPLVFVGAVDQLPALYERRTLPKNRLGYVPWPLYRAGLKAGKKSDGLLDIDVLAVAPGEPLSGRLGDFNVIHSDAPLQLNEIEPGESLISAGALPQPPAAVAESAKPETATAGARAELSRDLSMSQLAALELPSTQLLVFGLVEHVV
jgi:hypothetical protein